MVLKESCDQESPAIGREKLSRVLEWRNMVECVYKSQIRLLVSSDLLITPI